MKPTQTFSVRALWQNRVEAPASIAARLKHYMALSRSARPSDVHWFGWEMPDTFFDIEAEPEKIEPVVKAAVNVLENGAVSADGGYIMNIPCFHGNPHDARGAGFMSLTAGSTWQNSFALFTDNDLADTTDPRLVTYDAMKTNVMSAAWSFEPDWCEAGPTVLKNYLDREVYNRPPMSLAWMIWLKPSLASLVDLPSYSWNTIVERYADGSLFMATSKETFDCKNNVHLEQARAIHRQIDPLNYTVPFDGRSGRSNHVPPFPKV